jgi:hypothetical protein
VAKEDGVKRGSKKARHDDRGAALGLSESVRGDPPREEGKRMLVEMLKGRPVLKEVLDIAPEVASLWLRCGVPSCCHVILRFVHFLL